MFVSNVMAEMLLPGGQAGPIGQGMRSISWDSGMSRPYYDKNDRPAVTINTGRYSKHDGRGGERVPIRQHVLIRDLHKYGLPVPPVANATTLRKEQWIEMDTRVQTAARYRLRALSDLGAAATYGGFNGMAKTVLEYETMTDPGEAIVDMDGLSMGRADSPRFGGQGMPLPITHCDFWFSARQIAASSNSGTPLPLATGEAAGRRVAETLEGTVIGTRAGMVYGGVNTALSYTNTSAVYGYTNFPQRLTKTNMPIPTGSNASTVLGAVLSCVDQLRANKFFGPFMLYHTNDYDQFMDNDYTLSGGNVTTQTLRNRLRAIEGIQDVRRLDMWFGAQPSSSAGPGYEVDNTLKAYSMLLVQMTSEVCELVDGMGITTLQWDARGGLQVMFKVMAIQAPRIKADPYGNCGILHATTS